MGCVSSKKARTLSSPESDDDTYMSSRPGNRPGHRLPTSGSLHVALRPLENIREESDKEMGRADDNGKSSKKGDDSEDNHSGNFKAIKKGASQVKSVFSIKLGRLSEAEQVATGWPAWLTSVAGEAIDGWIPLRSDAYEKLEKIGQGTYSNVYRAREVKTGKLVAIKKVRFDNFQPESVRFMAREIMILRRLDHPNIMRLEGIITSRLSCSIYLVFPYMEHDLAGLLSCPDIKFTDAQIKCYMKQLLSGLEHCHSQGILHRDIKSSNILVNNEGILKIADFGLATFAKPRNKQPLTSRVVTLWYRPPELLLGATNYGGAVDLWSVGCVFAELFIGRPLLKGRTEVEQLHKIFKLCGTPPEDYWKKCRLPLANMFKPQQTYESTLKERCKDLPESAVSLIEIFLSVEPYKRGTAASALDSKYFTSEPLVCDPSSLPKYQPNKEIDAKIREEARRKKSSATAKGGEAGSRKPRRVRRNSQETSDFCKVVPTEEAGCNVQAGYSNRSVGANGHRRRGSIESQQPLKQSYDTKSEVSQASHTLTDSQGSSTRSVPVQVSASTGFAWAKRSKQKQRDVFARLATPKSQISHPTDPASHAHDTLDSDGQEHSDSSGRMCERAKRREQLQRRKLDSFDSLEIYEPEGLSEDHGGKRKGKIGHSGQENASRQHDQPRQAPHRSRFYHKDV